MSELVPIPLDVQLRRAFLEYEREGKIFDLPRAKFFRNPEGLDLGVWSNGRHASTPLGPAAGPHTQLLQNIVLCWLGGARIIELKTVQVLDELKIPRPCIDARNVTYNVEWSQELKLEQSLREYVSAAMFLQILNASGLLDDGCARGDTIFDMSVGYNLEGLRSARMRQWIEGMKDASRVIDELRQALTGRFRGYRDLPFTGCVSDTVTLSTFHGCPPEQIEGIVTFLLTEMDVHVCVKMNPTLLGKEQVSYLLHDVLGYHDIVLVDDAFEKDLKFDDAVELIPRLDAVARAQGKRLSLKFTNTLVVRNTGGRFADELIYMSGAPLHVLAMNLVKKFRERARGPQHARCSQAGVDAGALTGVPGTRDFRVLGWPLTPISFSAGISANNVANAVALGFVPVTTCTDLLKPGGYGRLHRYGENLGEAMRHAGATTIPEFVVRYAGCGAEAIDRTVRQLRTTFLEIGEGLDQWRRRPVEAWVDNAIALYLREWLDHSRQDLRTTCDQIAREFVETASDLPKPVVDAYGAMLANLEQSLAETAALLNTPVLVEQATSDPRYNREQNKATPRKVPSKLALFDCLSCDKCVPVCPNNANFVYEAPATEVTYQNYELLSGGGIEAIVGGVFKIAKSHQLANFVDACNDCGNCDVFCPEDGGPNIAKPRFFGSEESFRKHAGGNGFYIKVAEGTKTIQGIIGGRAYRLVCDAGVDCARFEDENGEYVIQPSRNALLSWRAKAGTQARCLDMLPYLQLKFLLDAVCDPRHVNYANVTALQGD